jgi:hypothetical protein
MKKLLLLALLALTAGTAAAQDAWRYVGEVRFPVADTAFLRPYFCTVTAAGRLYVTSSALTDANARNAVYFADSADTQLRLMVDYFLNGDQDSLVGNIGQIRGIGSVGRDILVNASVPYRRSQPNTVASNYYYPRGDTALVQKFGFYHTGAGYGTHNHGAALTSDTIAYLGVTAGATGPGPFPRFYNFSYRQTTPARGSWLSATYNLEPGGVHNGGFDIIRDCAVRPNGNYNDSTVAWFTSRNSGPTTTSGGIAIWLGGRQTNPAGYVGQRVQDPFGLLALGSSISYGIAVDNNGYLWVAGNDSTRRWVKAFDVTGGIFASEVFELPARFSATNPDPLGAPMINPVDVALSPNGRVAYVPDASNRTVYKFRFGPPVSVDDRREVPLQLTLDQNYPNPFNPTTVIAFSIPAAAHTRLVVSDLLGREVAVLADGMLEAGRHVRPFQAGLLASGVYHYTLTAGTLRLTRNMMLVR